VTKEFERIEIETICPVCKKNISEIWVAKLDSVIGVRYAYICINCKSLIKITNEKYLTAEQISQIILPK
jgi:protein-arginine kinase activator protein McsA